MNIGTPKGALLVLLSANPPKVQDHCLSGAPLLRMEGMMTSRGDADLNHLNQVEWDGY